MPVGVYAGQHGQFQGRQRFRHAQRSARPTDCDDQAMGSSAATFVLLNPHAGGGRAGTRLAAIGQHLSQRGSAAQVHAAADVAGALALVRAWPAGSRVVLAGGDGSLSRMLPALLSQQHEVGLLPMGTGNDTARAFGLQRLGWRAALDFALDQAAHPTDLGEASSNGQSTPFISSLAAGFDAAVAERALHTPRWLRGMARYLVATFAELAALRRYELSITLDGRLIHQGSSLFASSLNTRTYGAGMPAVPQARIDDGRLDLLLAQRLHAWGALALMPRLLTGTHLSHAQVSTRAFQLMQIRCTSPLPLAADGECLPATTELQVRVLPGALMAVRQPV